MQNLYWEDEILVVVSKAEEANLHDFCCKVTRNLYYMAPRLHQCMRSETTNDT